MEDLELPACLRLTPEQRAAARNNAPPVVVAPSVVSRKRGRYPEHWYLDQGTRAMIMRERYGDKMGEWHPGLRYSVFWKPEKDDKLLFLGYHDSSRSDASWNSEYNAYIVEGGDRPEVDWPESGVPFDQMPAKATRPLESGAKVKQARQPRAAADGTERAPRPVGKASDADTLPKDATIAILKAHGRKPGTGKWQRAELVVAHKGQTVAAFLTAGGNPTTLKNAVKEKWVGLNT